MSDAPTAAILTAEISNFPASRLTAARDALGDAYQRIYRAAVKAGQDAPPEPAIAVTREGWATRCAECKCEGSGTRGGLCMDCGGVLICRPVVDLTISWAPLKLAGWEFLAVVEPLVGGNLIRQVPGAQIAQGELAAWRHARMDCDHCQAKRRRAETFIVRADGSDPAIATGTYRCVGRSCLAAFMGGRSPAALLSSIEWRDLVIKIGSQGEGEGGGWGERDAHFESVEFLAWVSAVVRIDGWTSRAVARSSDRTATADIAMGLLTPPFGDRSRWNQSRAMYQPLDADRERALATLSWARDLSGMSDYEQNLRLVALQPALDRSHCGILASAISARDRQLGESAKPRSEKASRHLGVIGEKRDFGSVTCERIASFDSDYGTVHVHTFRDSNGNAIVWKTGSRKSNEGDVTTMLVGTVKRHSDFRGEAQTELSRCALLDDAAVALRSEPKPRKAKAKAAQQKTAMSEGSSLDSADAEDPPTWKTWAR